MCDECHQNPCANTCPNNPNYYDVRYKTCPICGNEYSEEYFERDVCDPCLVKAATYENALKLGKKETGVVTINGFLAYVFSADEIETILRRELEEKGNVLLEDVRVRYSRDFCLDDKGAFADWLLKQKNP